MNVPRYASLAARLLKRAMENVSPPSSDRARGLMTIEHAMVARGRRRRWHFSLAALVAAVAPILIWQLRSGDDARHAAEAVGAVSPLGNGATLQVGPLETPLLAQTTVGTGATIETARDGGAALQLATRSSLVLSGATSLRIDGSDRTQRFAVRRGGLSANVAKLASGHRFILETPDAEVEVRGTQFALRVLEQPQACGSGSRTRLDVSEGVVEVRAFGRASRVGAGQSWPADCAQVGRAPAGALVTEAGPPSGAAARSSASAGTATARPIASTGSNVGGPSALTRQNDLFAEGVALRRQGDVGGALRAYQELITRFPSSPLAENAMVERMRLLSTNQRVRAKEEARRLTDEP